MTQLTRGGKASTNNGPGAGTLRDDMGEEPQIGEHSYGLAKEDSLGRLLVLVANMLAARHWGHTVLMGN
uniref:Uncharacterized protein n=1 Tax=Sphaerodactylus townsendi TaxID=933632 RepID=A0ACB8FDV6_9SAUR